MRGARIIIVAAVVLALSGANAAAAQRQADPLARARQLYNDGQYDAVIMAARQARERPASRNIASLVLGRALLERFRLKRAEDDLREAHHILQEVEGKDLTSRDQLELIVGLAETLFLEESYGAAAEMFDTVLDRAADLGAAARERVLDWWATSIDKQARARAPAERLSIYQRVLDRMEHELQRNITSASASYWLPVAARGVGDLDRAWHATTASWVRAPLTALRGATLRPDLDRLMTVAIIPERARRQAGSQRSAQQLAEAMTADWENVKQQWK